MSRAYCCEVCNGRPDWRIDAFGDRVTTWACHTHLVSACGRLLRDRNWDIHATLAIKVATLPEGMEWESGARP